MGDARAHGAHDAPAAEHGAQRHRRLAGQHDPQRHMELAAFQAVREQ